MTSVSAALLSSWSRGAAAGVLGLAGFALSSAVCPLTEAATVRFAQDVTTFVADRGEANDVHVRREGATWVIRDRDRTFRTPVTATLRVELGDRDDDLLLEVAATVDAGSGEDSIIGSGADDVIDGGTGADRLHGGGGADTLTFATRRGAVTIDMVALRTSDRDFLSPFATVVGGAGDDVIRGSGDDETFRGGPGDDRLLGGHHEDTLLGEAGDDRLFGQAGDDVLDGGEGDDLSDGGLDRDTVRDTGGGRNLLRGGPSRDTIFGGSASDRIEAGAAADRVDAGGGGRDRVDCGPGADRVRADRVDSLQRC